MQTRRKRLEFCHAQERKMCHYVIFDPKYEKNAYFVRRLWISLPRIIVSDMGSHFKNAVLQALTDTYRIKHDIVPPGCSRVIEQRGTRYSADYVI